MPERAEREKRNKNTVIEQNCVMVNARNPCPRATFDIRFDVQCTSAESLRTRSNSGLMRG